MAICGGEELEGHDAGMARIGGSVARDARRQIPGRAVIVQGQRHVIGETQVLEDIASQVGIDSVRVATQFVKDFLTGRALEVEQHAALASVEGIEIEAVRAALPGRNIAADIAPGGGILQPDDVGAEVGQMKGTERPGAELLHGNDADARERSLLHAELLQAGSSAHTMAEVYRQWTCDSTGCDGRAKPKITSCSITPSVKQGFGTACGKPPSTCSSCPSRATSSTSPESRGGNHPSATWRTGMAGWRAPSCGRTPIPWSCCHE